LGTLWLIAQLADPPAAKGWEGIAQGNGLAIALTGMLIVFVALVLISLYIAAVPRVLARIEPFWPTSAGHHVPRAREEQTPLDEERVVAAIGMVLHAEMQKAITRTK